MSSSASVLTGFLIMLCVTIANAHPDDHDKYVFVISKINYLNAIEDAVSRSGAEDIKVSEVRVILCGAAVKAIAEQDPAIKKAMQNPRIKLYACGLSLNQIKIDRKLLPTGVGAVPNGILEAMKLQKSGYKTFDI